MRWFNNLSFRSKLLLPVTMLSAIMVTIALLSLVIIGNLGHKAREISHQHLPSVDFLLQADRDLYKVLVAERSIIFLDVNTPEFADLGKRHEENIQRAQGNVDKFRRVAGSLVRASLKDFDQRFTDWAATTRKIISERRDNGRIGRRSAIDLSFGQGAKQFAAVRSIIDELTKAVLANSEATVGRIDEAVAGSRPRMLGALGIGLSICVLVALLFPKMVTGPLLSILDRVEDIADGDGDLTVRVPVGSDDEIGQLGDAFNRFIGKLETMVSEIVSSTSRLANAAEQMSGVSFASSDALGKQRVETEQAATAMKEMAATAQEVAQNASHAAEAAQEADDQAGHGTRVVAETISAIRGLAGEVESAATVIAQLEADSDSIGTILDVIRGIAEQTNLLALNAAIEAARAGEQGRGFAVVADEVRTLAQRTQQSTQEIQTMIESLQSGAQEAVKVMTEGRVHAQTSVDQAVSAEVSLEAITKAVSRISKMNIQIASAAEEQTAVSVGINHSVVSINELTEQNAEGSQQTATAVAELARLSAKLESLVGEFKVA